MKSIRQRLTGRLILGWALVLLLGSGLVYVVARTSLVRQFDNALRAKARALASQIEFYGDNLALDPSDQFGSDFGTRANTAFFEVWNSAGQSAERSQSLKNGHLPMRYGTLHAPEFWNLDLPSGLAGRAVGLKVQIPIGKTEDQAADRIEAILVVAVDRRELDAALTNLSLVLAGSGLLVMILTAGIVPLLLRRELAPLDRLAEQAQRITPGSLSARFCTRDLPAELAPISTRLNDLMQRLQAAFELERQFSDDLAHEFRTPIAELRSLAELSLKWPDARTEDTDRSVLAIALQMESIINRLLAIARGEEGQAPMSPEAVDLPLLVKAVWQPLQAKASARQLAIELDLPPSLVVHSDPVLLRSIVTNLADNAVEYAPARSTVRIQSESQNGHFTLRVTNPVDRLAAEDLPCLFDRFWRKDAARSGTTHAGLGLSLSRAFAIRLGYALSAILDAAQGLTMTLSGPERPALSQVGFVGPDSKSLPAHHPSGSS